MAPPGPDPLITTVIALLSGGTAKFFYDAVKQWRGAPPRGVRTQAVVDANIATVSRARDELEADLVTVRALLADERAARASDEVRHAAERARWLADQERLRADVDRLEKRLLEERLQAAARYDALLEQVHQLRLRANTQEESR